MRTRSKLWLTALAATALLATAVGTATARNFQLSENNIRTTFHNLSFFNGSSNLECDVTMEGSFHARTFAKTVTLLGYITKAGVNETTCRGTNLFSGGRARIENASLPWHISYEGFEGALPRITKIFLLLNQPKFIFTNLPIVGTCSYRGNAKGWFEVVAHTIDADETFAIPRTAESSGFCPANGFFRGRAPATVLNSSTAITVTLI